MQKIKVYLGSSNNLIVLKSIDILKNLSVRIYLFTDFVDRKFRAMRVFAELL